MTEEHEPNRSIDLSCNFCGSGTWATWEVVTDDGVSFACDRHHVELSEAKIIRLERMKGKETWEEYLDDLTDFKDVDDYE
jgi:hypothetical protein